MTTSVSKKRWHGITSASVVPPLVWLVYAKGANGMPGKDSTKVKGLNAGRKTIDCDEFRATALALGARWLLPASLTCTVSGHRTAHVHDG
jgi:hypothetical protein